MDVKNKLMVTRISKGGINGESGIDICILLYIQQITNNFLSRWEIYSVLHNGLYGKRIRKNKRMDIHISITWRKK